MQDQQFKIVALKYSHSDDNIMPSSLCEYF